jgi:hypothetical protein
MLFLIVNKMLYFKVLFQNFPTFLTENVILFPKINCIIRVCVFHQ